jgi:hypothetical protein
VGSCEVRARGCGGMLRTDKPRSHTRGRALGYERPGLHINDKEVTRSRFMVQYARNLTLD